MLVCLPKIWFRELVHAVEDCISVHYDVAKGCILNYMQSLLEIKKYDCAKVIEMMLC